MQNGHDSMVHKIIAEQVQAYIMPPHLPTDRYNTLKLAWSIDYINPLDHVMPIRIDVHSCTGTTSHMWIQCAIKSGRTVIVGALVPVQISCNGFLHADGQACWRAPAV